MTQNVSATPALELIGVAKIYGRSVALRATNLRLERGEALALLGPNGSGKTTLLKIVAGALTPTAGRARIFGRDMFADRAEVRLDAGLLSSDTYLYDDLSARENLRFVATMLGRPLNATGIDALLRRVRLESQADARVRSFSSGMKRRLSLARLLLLSPRLLLLDEPYNSLDAAGADLVDEVVREALAEGRSAMVATHDAERALQLAGRVAVLDRGRMRYLGPVASYRREHRVV